MTSKSSEQSLRDLEHSELPPLELLDLVDSILGIKIGEIGRRYLGDPTYHPPRLSFAPREEWVLRWLMKKSDPTPGRPDPSDDPRTRFICDLRTWVLFFYLVDTIPFENLTRILLEREFFPKLIEKLQQLLQYSGELSSAGVSAVDGERQPKRRKVDRSTSRGSASHLETPGTTYEVALNLMICRSVLYCTKPSLDSQPSSGAWNLLPGQAAEVVSLLLELVLSALQATQEDWQSDILLSLIEDIIACWDIACRVDSSFTQSEKSLLYHNRCSKASTAILLWLHQSSVKTESQKDPEKILEYMISLHTIMPLRAALNDALKSGWTKDMSLLTWDKFHNLSAVVGEYFDSATSLKILAEENLPTYSMSMQGPILLDIAIRSIPLGNLRRRQREQPWLEAFFLSLVYLVYPSMPKMEEVPKGHLQKMDIIQEQDLGDSLKDVEALLNILIKGTISISLPALSYLTSAILTCEVDGSLWRCVARLLALNPDVLIPKSGLDITATCLDQVCTRIRDSGAQDTDCYEIIRDQIITPLIKGFARARDLSGFMKVWLDGLENSIISLTFTDSKNQEPGLKFVWDDEVVFEEFAKVARTNTSPSLARTLLAETLQGLQGLGNRVGSTADILAKLAVLDVFVASCPEQLNGSTDDLRKLVDALITVLKVRSTYQSQRWRLWRVLRRCLHLVQDYKLSNGYLQLKTSPIRPVSVDQAEQISKSQSSGEMPAALRELVECFHLIMSSDNGSNADNTDVRRSEVIKLASLLDSLSEKTRIGHIQMWDGSTGSLDNPAAVAEACIGILCQNPRPLLADTETTHKLLISMCQNSNSAFALAGPNQTPTLVEALLANDELATNSPLYQQCFEALTESIGDLDRVSTIVRGLLQQMPLSSMPRPRLQKVATLVENRIRDSKPSTTAEDLVSDLALLERLTTSAAVSISKPQNWRQLVDIADILDQQVLVSTLRTYSVCIRCLRAISESLWKRMGVLEDLPKNRKLASDIAKWCTKRVEDGRFFDAGIPSFTLLTCLVDGLYKNMDMPLFAELKGEILRLGRSFFTRLLKEFRELTSSAVSNDLLFTLHYAVQALSQCNSLSQESDGLQSLVETFDMVVENWLEVMGQNETVSNIRASSILQRARHVLSQLAPSGTQMHGRKGPTRGTLQLLMSRAKESGLKDPRVRAQSAIEYVYTLGSEDRTTLLSLLETQVMAGVFRYELTSAIVYRTTPAEVQESPHLKQTLNGLASLQFALEAKFQEELCMALECVRIILDRHPEVVNQWAVDNLLSSIAILATPMMQWSADSSAVPEASINDAIFTRLCDLLGLVLTRFRRRLQGRYHLLLPAIQNLLRCLFYPGAIEFESSHSKSHTQMQFVESLPLWIRESRLPLQPASATKYARILGSICDPTASSVKSSTNGRSRSTAELTDDTKKAKRIAGQYMQYLIMEYAKCNLDGQTSPETKEKLMPGLYAVLDVMPRELMRGMNAAMDASSRAIFKGLYDDYQKFGKWDKN